MLEHTILYVQWRVADWIHDVPPTVSTLSQRFEHLVKKVFMNLEMEVSTGGSFGRGVYPKMGAEAGSVKHAHSSVVHLFWCFSRRTTICKRTLSASISRSTRGKVLMVL
jgi:hypothetical protein